MIVYSKLDDRWIFLGLFTFASITDFFDGYLARKYGLISNFGRIFDSIADKALVIILCIIVLLKNPSIVGIIIIPIVIMILREIIISGIREGLANKHTIRTSRLGKYKALLQMLALGFLIIGGEETSFYLYCQYIGIIILYLSVIVSLISGYYYLKQSYKYFVE